MKTLMITMLFFGFPAIAKTVIFGAEAQTKYDELIEQIQLKPGSVSVSTNLFFGSDTHPNWGKLRLTDLVTIEGTYVRCWKEDYFETQNIEYGCEIE